MTAYRRALSAGEAREGFIFVTKKDLKLFAPLGEEFTLRVGDEAFKRRLVAVRCSCVGTPHEHYRIPVSDIMPLRGLRRGSMVILSKQGDGIYVARVHEKASSRGG